MDIGRLEPKLLEQDSLPTRLFRLERVKDEKELITTVKDIANRFRQEERHQELARILCGWVKRIGLKRLKIEDQRFEAIHELEEFGAMLENVLPDWEERIRKDERAMLENVLPDWEERIRKENTNEIAKKMLALNEKIEKIMQFTGLTKEDILALKIQNANV